MKIIDAWTDWSVSCVKFYRYVKWCHCPEITFLQIDQRETIFSSRIESTSSHYSSTGKTFIRIYRVTSYKVHFLHRSLAILIRFNQLADRRKCPSAGKKKRKWILRSPCTKFQSSRIIVTKRCFLSLSLSLSLITVFPCYSRKSVNSKVSTRVY